MTLLWAMALLSLLLLPSDYRGGGEIVHGHSLVQLLIDDADGVVDHHHLLGTTMAAHARAFDWLDPTVPDSASPGQSGPLDPKPDVGEHQDSAPTVASVHLLLATIAVMLAVVASVRIIPLPARRLTGRAPRVLLPPPRWLPVAA